MTTAPSRSAAPSPARLMRAVSQYLSPEHVEIVRRAYAFAAEAHDGQLRDSGQPYITHPLAAAETLAELHLDADSIAAGLLHDVAEDVGVELKDIAGQFGPDVAKLVDGVTKLNKMDWLQQPEARDRGRSDDQSVWAENMRKMFLAMAEDIRVVLIKLADRLHNMRTLEALPEVKRKRIAQETMDIYAPLANRLGIWQVKWQLEDLAFSHLEPERYHEIATKLSSRRQSRERYIAQVVSLLKGELGRNGITAEVSGRAKHIYSISRKMQERGADISQIYDLLAVRVLVDNVQECYSVLGTVHQLWHPLPGQFDDYIAKLPRQWMPELVHGAQD